MLQFPATVHTPQLVRAPWPSIVEGPAEHRLVLAGVLQAFEARAIEQAELLVPLAAQEHMRTPLVALTTGSAWLDGCKASIPVWIRVACTSQPDAKLLRYTTKTDSVSLAPYNVSPRFLRHFLDTTRRILGESEAELGIALTPAGSNAFNVKLHIRVAQGMSLGDQSRIQQIGIKCGLSTCGTTPFDQPSLLYLLRKTLHTD